MKRLAFIDHSFHIKSTATQFLIELLSKKFDVKVFWDDSWNGGTSSDLKVIKDEGFDFLIFFQMMHYDHKIIEKLNFEQVIFIPMYDGIVHMHDYEWREYAAYKFINFSKKLHDKLVNFGIQSLYIQYFPNVSNFEAVNTRYKKGFFWQRTNFLEWDTIIKLIDKTNFKSFHFHSASDPLQEKMIPSDKDQKKFNITITDWFEEKEEFLKVLRNSNVFFAPRLYEGIGMAFLEAMAMGMCVIAPDHPTMNEYIENGHTGLLYDPFSPEALDFSNAEEISKNAKEYCSVGYNNWQKKKESINQFIVEKSIYDYSMLNIPQRSLGEYIKQVLKIIYQYLPEVMRKIVRRVYYSLFRK